MVLTHAVEVKFCQLEFEMKVLLELCEICSKSCPIVMQALLK